MSNGISLNDTLLVGPNLQNSLFSILIKFRCYEYVFTADISKMYRQILIDPEETNLQRILWRDNSNEKIKAFQLLTVTYGTASASYLATRCLLKLAADGASDYPLGAKNIQENFYVDDMLSNDLNTLNIIKEQTIKLLESGGFKLHKWSSNHSSLLHELEREISIELVDLEKNTTIKTIGVQWSPYDDKFQYKIHEYQNQGKITKRTMLSLICQIFDPLVLISSIVISAKILIQKLWQLKSDWDESVPQNIHEKWIQFQGNLHLLNKLKISRKVICKSKGVEHEMHEFCDASELAYGACVYFRTKNKDNTYDSYLVASKSRVSPIKSVSIPRLELCAALLLTELIEQIKESVEDDLDKIYYCQQSL